LAKAPLLLRNLAKIKSVTAWVSKYNLLLLFSPLISFWVFRITLASSAGIADKDEGLYLLAADAASKSVAWPYPWGWHTGPIFNLTNFEIGNFRALGAVILFTLSLIFTNSIYQYFIKINYKLNLEIKFKNLLILIVSFSFTSIFYGSFYFRTPGYNWVSLVGALIASIGLIRQLNYGENNKLDSNFIISVSLFSLGLFVSAPAKPSTPVLMTALSVIVLTYSGIKIKNWLFFTPITFSILILLAIITKVWPSNFMEVFIRSYNTPPVDNDQTILGALINIIKMPSYFLGDIRTNTILIIFAMCYLFIHTIFLLIKKKFSQFKPLYILMILIILFASGLSFNAFDMIKTENATLNMWKLPSVLMILLAHQVIAIYILENFRLSINNKTRAILFYCLVTPFVLSFGSAHGIFNMVAFFSGFVVLLIVLSSYLIMNVEIRLFFNKIIFGFVVFLVATISFQSYQNPWNISPTSENIVELSVGRHGKSVYVDKTFASEIENSRKELVSAGWKIGEPLLGLNWHIATTIPYILGAKPPNSLMLTIYGYDQALKTMRFNLGPAFDPYPYDQAWLMISSKQGMTKGAEVEIQEALAILQNKTLKEFPSEYQFVTKFKEIEFWRPKK
jgi:hypothetical protein